MAGQLNTALRWQLGYRRQLDGARGFAIALVVLGHALAIGMSTPAVGVTLFFVLSGFLITSLLWEERERSGRVALGRFYARRARRLLPAFAIVAAAVLAFAVLTGGWREGLFNAIVASSYVGNWAMAMGTWLGPLSHAWSLAIEEQFYLVWPVTLVFAARFVSGKTFAILLFVAALAVATARTLAWMHGVPSDRIAFATEFQADGLLLGSALAVVMHIRPFSLPRVTRPVAFATLIVLAVVVPQPLWLGFGNTLAVLVSGALVAALAADTGADVVFENRVLVGLGLVSYGLYLWHYPILWQLGFTNMPPYPGVTLAVLGVGASLVAAVASYTVVERRFRRAQRPTDGDVARLATKPAMARHGAPAYQS